MAELDPGDVIGSRDGASLVAERHLTTLRHFVIRARRVEEHSLAADKDKLVEWARGTMKIRFGQGIQSTAQWDLPEEEALDSLAARCRPFILSNDSVYHGKVLKALGFFLRDHNDALTNAHKEIKASWQRLDRSSKDLLAYASRVAPIGDPLGGPITDKTLAYAWLYGDLVHADDVTDRIGGHDIDSRYRGGVLLIANIAVETIKTLNVLRAARHDGLVEIDDTAFTDRVTARGSVELPLSGFVAAPVGTPSTDLEDALDALGAPSKED